MNDKTNRLFEILDNPDSFTDDELDKILDDPEESGLYSLLSKTADALTETNTPDVEKEWNRFAAEHNGKTGRLIPGILRSFISRNAAAVILCIVTPLLVVAATIAIRYSIADTEALNGTDAISDSVLVKAPETAESSETATTTSPSEEFPRTVVFKNETLDNIITSIAGFYGTTVTYSKDRSKALRLYFQWDTTLPLDEIVEQLNQFEQIKIKRSDDTLTIQ